MSHAAPASSAEVVAAPVANEIEPNAACPPNEWQSASPISFCSDWRGKNPDPAHQTEVPALWAPSTLYLRFVSRYRGPRVFDAADPNAPGAPLLERVVSER